MRQGDLALPWARDAGMGADRGARSGHFRRVDQSEAPGSGIALLMSTPPKSETLHLTEELIARPSVSPADGGCQALMIGRLEAIGFTADNLRFGPVDNFWDKRGRGGLYGRGAADMKSGLAAMLTACEEFVGRYPSHRGTIAFLITSDEEGPSVDGTRRVVEVLRARKENIDWCLVGEPSSESALGDTIKIGRRGSLSGRLTVHGIQGHIAYPQFADNPVHAVAPALAELASRTWDRGNEHFQPPTFQVSNISAGTGAPNVIPGELKARFNLRFSTEQTVDGLKTVVEKLLQRHRVKHTLEWFISGYPFLTVPGELSEAATRAVQEQLQLPPTLSTGGGTSDGRFIAPMGAQVIELGVINASIHKVNECVRVADIDALQRIYLRILELLLAP